MLDCDYVKNIARENIGTEVFVLIFLEHDPYFFARYIHSWETKEHRRTTILASYTVFTQLIPRLNEVPSVRD